ncbi:uncharacterized protein LOC125904210 [Epinephelus fuscoguttatus]|uniref:uncharacterized protein LOC125904210 n=1 Tax=Epinephelus fuscoguttatus TaxID=293821 RepID=UPI0020D0F176|nr:uncharacterized protein LOC125904210 [Epinephelus fuscoguttatus]
MVEEIQQVRPRHKMRLYIHLDVSKLTLLSLVLLCPVPRNVTSYPHSPTALLPSGDRAELESALLLLQSAVNDPWAEWPQDPQLALLKPKEEKKERSWEEEALLRAQRGDLVPQPLSPFPGGHSRDIMIYQGEGEGEDGGKRNEDLTSIIGGLQAVSREKGGFGFRFGRKRWTDRGWMD